jgi:hypothetical protein
MPSCRTMFLRYYLELLIPFERAEEALIAIPRSLAGELLQEAGDQAERLLAEVGFNVAARRIKRQVTIAFRDPTRLGSRTLLPLTWEATGRDGRLPALEGDLEVAPVGPKRTQLSISARYTPPLGAFGRGLDRALLHRVAEATVKDLLDRIAAAISKLDSAAVTPEASVRASTSVEARR